MTLYFEERDDLVSFLIGCSFSFESALLDADIPVRQTEEGVNVPDVQHQHSLHACGGVQRQHGRQYAAHPVCAGARGGSHHGGMPRVHGAPVQIGTPEAIGITDLDHPTTATP